MRVKAIGPLVSVEWLYQNIDAENIVVIDATMRKITLQKNEIEDNNLQIKKARFLDIKNVFSDTTSEYPNTMLPANTFEVEAQKLGINKDSAIVVYDSIGIYTSPRVWWMFKAMGHENVAVLNGGFPEWIREKSPTEAIKQFTGNKGSFTVNYNSNYFSNKLDVLNATYKGNIQILDARSLDRFNGNKKEPRKGLRSGHISNSKNLYYNSLLVDGKMKAANELRSLFNEVTPKNNKLIFSCGSGITACILALGAEISGFEKLSVYDGSWTEWGSSIELPIE